MLHALVISFCFAILFSRLKKREEVKIIVKVEFLGSASIWEKKFIDQFD